MKKNLFVAIFLFLLLSLCACSQGYDEEEETTENPYAELDEWMSGDEVDTEENSESDGDFAEESSDSDGEYAYSMDEISYLDDGIYKIKDEEIISKDLQFEDWFCGLTLAVYFNGNTPDNFIDYSPYRSSTNTEENLCDSVFWLTGDSADPIDIDRNAGDKLIFIKQTGTINDTIRLRKCVFLGYGNHVMQENIQDSQEYDITGENANVYDVTKADHDNGYQRTEHNFYLPLSNIKSSEVQLSYYEGTNYIEGETYRLCNGLYQYEYVQEVYRSEEEYEEAVKNKDIIFATVDKTKEGYAIIDVSELDPGIYRIKSTDNVGFDSLINIK